MTKFLFAISRGEGLCPDQFIVDDIEHGLDICAERINRTLLTGMGVHVQASKFEYVPSPSRHLIREVPACEEKFYDPGLPSDV